MTGLSVWLCGEAEIILNETDPGSVVLDEIIAIPVCFAAWTWHYHLHHGIFPQISNMTQTDWFWILGIFAAFRFFDIAKPWPVRQSQNLPGGWGVTIDDLLAAVYVNLITLPLLYLNR